MRLEIKNSLKQFQTDYLRLLIVVVMFFSLFFYWKQICILYPVNSIIEMYDRFTGLLTQSLAQVVGVEIAFDANSGLLNYQNKMFQLVLPYNFYNIFFASFALLILLPKKEWKTIIAVLIFTLLFISFRSGIKSIVEIAFKTSVHKWLLIWIGSTIYLPFYMIFICVIKLNEFIKSYYKNIESLFKDRIIFNIEILVLMLILLPTLPLVLMMYFTPNLIKEIVHFVLSISNIILQQIGYNSSTYGKIIYLENNWVQLEANCLGIGVQLIILMIIISFKSKFYNKLIFSTIFVILFNLFNSIRLAGLLIYINDSYKETVLNFAKIHNYVSELVYVFAFLYLFMYILWFSDINLKKLFSIPQK